MFDSKWKQQSPMMKVLTVFGAAVGYVIGQYAGIQVFLPVLSILVIAIALKRLAKPPFQRYVLIFSIVCGHLITILIGGLFTRQYLAVLPDLLFVGIGLTWLLLRPGVAALVYLSILQLAIGSLNFNNFLQAPYGSLPHKALSVHLLIRAWVLTLMVHEIWREKRQERE